MIEHNMRNGQITLVECPFCNQEFPKAGMVRRNHYSKGQPCGDRINQLLEARCS